MNFGNVKTFVSNNSPELLIGAGIATLISGTFLSARAALKADNKLRAKRFEKWDAKNDASEDLTFKEKVKYAAPYYVPAAAAVVVGSGLVITGLNVEKAYATGLASVIGVTENRLADYIARSNAHNGPLEYKGPDGVRGMAHNDNIPNEEDVEYTSWGKDLCYDTVMGHYFRSNVDRVDSAVNRVNEKLIKHDVLTGNEIAEEFGEQPCKAGEFIGWRSDWGMMEVRYETRLRDGYEPVIDIYYDVRSINEVNAR